MRREMIMGVRRPEYDPKRCTYAPDGVAVTFLSEHYQDTIALSQAEMSMVLTAIELALKVETTGLMDIAPRAYAADLRDILCKLDI